MMKSVSNYQRRGAAVILCLGFMLAALTFAQTQPAGEEAKPAPADPGAIIKQADALRAEGSFHLAREQYAAALAALGDQSETDPLAARARFGLHDATWREGWNRQNNQPDEWEKSLNESREGLRRIVSVLPENSELRAASGGLRGENVRRQRERGLRVPCVRRGRPRDLHDPCSKGYPGSGAFPRRKKEAQGPVCPQRA